MNTLCLLCVFHTSKTVNAVKTEYYLEGSDVIWELSDNGLIHYLYDASGVCGMELVNSSTVYWFVKNAQGDIIQILDDKMNVVVKYDYSAYGEILYVKDANHNNITDPNHIGNLNPYRYRSYRYDTETGLYYLQSRYYNPQWCRFINADGMVSTGQGLMDKNMYTYCLDNPIAFSDSSGAVPHYTNEDGTTSVYNMFNGSYFVAETGAVDTARESLEPMYANPPATKTKTSTTVVSTSQLQDIGFKTSDTTSDQLNQTLVKYSISSPEQISHFLAQCAKETEFGQFLTEYGGKSYFANKKYGFKYRGGGYLQLTWDYNYLAFAEAIGDMEIYNQGADYVAANYAWESAGWFWHNKNLNAKIDSGASVKDVTKVVRGGTGTWEQRQEYYNKIYGIIG